MHFFFLKKNIYASSLSPLSDIFFMGLPFFVASLCSWNMPIYSHITVCWIYNVANHPPCLPMAKHNIFDSNNLKCIHDMHLLMPH